MSAERLSCRHCTLKRGRGIYSGELCSSGVAALIIYGALSLWAGRNARRHGRDRRNPTAAVKHVAAMIEELVCLEEKKPVPYAEDLDPGRGWHKVKTDASFRAASATGAGGVVIWDEDGRLLEAAARRYEHLPDALTAEAMVECCWLVRVAMRRRSSSLFRREVDEMTFLTPNGSFIEFHRIGNSIN
ncbi:hypothetical protein EJB05_32844, partial [Eragrostis curvula]